jgi:hypothetical protein
LSLTESIREFLTKPGGKPKRTLSADRQSNAATAATSVKLPNQFEVTDSDCETSPQTGIRQSSSYIELREPYERQSSIDVIDTPVQQGRSALLAEPTCQPNISAHSESIPAGYAKSRTSEPQAYTSDKAAVEPEPVTSKVHAGASSTQQLKYTSFSKQQMDVSDTTSEELASSDDDFDTQYLNRIFSPINSEEPSAPLPDVEQCTSTHVSTLYPVLNRTEAQATTAPPQRVSPELDIEPEDSEQLSAAPQHKSVYAPIKNPTLQIVTKKSLPSHLTPSSERKISVLTSPLTTNSTSKQTVADKHLTFTSAVSQVAVDSQPETSLVQATFAKASSIMNVNPHLSDQLIAPTPFANDGQQKAEKFLTHFLKYARIKQFEGHQKIELFSLLLRGDAATWIDTLEPATTACFDRLVDEFKRAFCVNENLIWMDHQKLFSTPQQPTESVTAFVTRIKNQARRLDLMPQTLLHSVIAGLRPNIRQFVVSQGGLTDLNTAIETALKAEATAVSDPMTAMLMESVQTQSKLAETQAKQLHELTERVNALTATKTELVAASANHWKDERSRERSRERGDRDKRSPSRDRSGESPRWERKPLKQTPQRMQKQNYVRSQRGEKPVAFENKKRPPAQTSQMVCRNCGYQHAQGQCRAKGVTCRNCQKLNHFAKMCRSARAPQQ